MKQYFNDSSASSAAWTVETGTGFMSNENDSIVAATRKDAEAGVTVTEKYNFTRRYRETTVHHTTGTTRLEGSFEEFRHIPATEITAAHAEMVKLGGNPPPLKNILPNGIPGQRRGVMGFLFTK